MTLCSRLHCVKTNIGITTKVTVILSFFSTSAMHEDFRKCTSNGRAEKINLLKTLEDDMARVLSGLEKLQLR